MPRAHPLRAWVQSYDSTACAPTRQKNNLDYFSCFKEASYSYISPTSCQEVFATVDPFPSCVVTITNVIYLKTLWGKTEKTYPTLFYDTKGPWGVFVYYFNSFQYRDVMNGFTYILLSVWFAWCEVFVSGKLIHACYIRWCSIVEVVVGMLCVPSLWLLLRCVAAWALATLFLLASASGVDPAWCLAAWALASLFLLVSVSPVGSEVVTNNDCKYY